ncbi:MAG: bifunctional N(6)-L-threonylcarbamoyladenine synthase/serine/threonine protein kinase [Nanoarchaeota archaeon]
MICLGIESTAHTFGIGIMDDKKKLYANVKRLYTTQEGGLVPAKIAEHHVQVCGDVIQEALKISHLLLSDIDLVSFSASPGIGNCLRIGLQAARALALIHNKPLVGVNHCIAHLEIGRALTKATDPVLLYASGANTQVIAFESGKYRIFGETLDLGVGNFLDAFARDLGLGFPGGPQVEKIALQSQNFIQLPYVVKGMDMSFSGLFTNLRQKVASQKFSKEDLCFSVQETVFAMLCEVTERALAHCSKHEVVLGGGVACNKRLQEMANQMCNARGAQCYFPENQFLVDNGAMIAWLGILEYQAGVQHDAKSVSVHPYLRTDQVEVIW